MPTQELTAAQEESPSLPSRVLGRRKTLLIATSALLVFCSVYAFLSLRDVEPALSKLLVAFSITGVAGVVLLGFAVSLEEANLFLVRQTQAAVAWACDRGSRTYAIASCLLVLAFWLMWFGIMSIYSFQVECQDGAELMWSSVFGEPHLGCDEGSVQIWAPGETREQARARITCHSEGISVAPTFEANLLRCAAAKRSAPDQHRELLEALIVVDERIRDYFIRVANVAIALDALTQSTFDESEGYEALADAMKAYNTSIEAIQIGRSQFLYNLAQHSESASESVKELIEDLDNDLHRAGVLTWNEIQPDVNNLQLHRVTGHAAQELRESLRAKIPRIVSRLRSQLELFRSRYQLLYERLTKAPD